MKGKETITLVVNESIDDDSERGMIPNLETGMNAIEVSKSAMAASLKQLLVDVNQMVAEAHSDLDGPARIDEVTVTVNVSRTGSIQWIASLGSNETRRAIAVDRTTGADAAAADPGPVADAIVGITSITVARA